MSVPMVAPGETMMEVMIPASKVGLIIGKGGETIKNIQVGELYEKICSKYELPFFFWHYSGNIVNHLY